ncbi:TPA: UDP-2,4-diacetamido-2,4,6-trideoxy-beta-L-altropyranose hydrolase [Providencia alcalifaciens]
MRVVFRVDASKWIGSGHVMRCLVLADALRQKQAEVLFACLPQINNLNNTIRAKGYTVIELTPPTVPIEPAFDGDYKSWLQRSSEEDAADFLSKVPASDWVVTDHYGLNYNWEFLIRKSLSCKVLSIDDLNRKHCSDILLDQNLWPNIKSRYQHFEHKKLLGPEYALLRENFSKYHISPPRKKEQVIAFFGGSDPTSECYKLFNAAIRFPKLPFTLKIITGHVTRSYENIKKLNTSSEVQVYQFLENFDEELASSKYAIGASGTSNWERFCLKVPSTIVSVAKNQEELSKFLSQKKFVTSLGLGTETTENDYYIELSRIVNIWQEILPFKAFDIDGLGSHRVVKEMELLSDV